MADEDILKRIEARLTRLEAALAQQPGGVGGTGQPGSGGAVVDPAPWPTQWGHPRWPYPIVDPGPWGGGWIPPRWPPMPVVDPAPWPTPVVDPAPYGVGGRQSTLGTFGRIGQIGDPPPIDVSRFSILQLESSLHSIHAEKARLDSMETMIKQQLEKLKKQG